MREPRRPDSEDTELDAGPVNLWLADGLSAHCVRTSHSRCLPTDKGSFAGIYSAVTAGASRNLKYL